MATRRRKEPVTLLAVALTSAATILPHALLPDLRGLIDQARRDAAAAVNAGLTMLSWRVGRRIGQDVLGGQRAGYGEQIVSTLSRQLAWSHFLDLIYLKDPLARDFDAHLAGMDRWSVRVLRERMASMPAPSRLARMRAGRASAGSSVGSCGTSSPAKAARRMFWR